VKEYVIASAVVLAAFFIAKRLSGRKHQLEILSLNHDTTRNCVELLVKNNSIQPCYVKSTLRAVDNNLGGINSVGKSGEDIPMMSGKSYSGRGFYNMIGWDKEPKRIEANGVKRIVYNIDAAAHGICAGDRVSVNVYYDCNGGVLRNRLSENVTLESIAVQKIPYWICGCRNPGLSLRSNAIKHVFLQPVDPSASFILKREHSEIVGCIHSLEELHETLAETHPRVIEFHLDGRNDFAMWVRDVIKDEELCEDLLNIEFESAEEARAKITDALSQRISELNSASGANSGLSVL